jgi:hypothetical protein
MFDEECVQLFDINAGSDFTILPTNLLLLTIGHKGTGIKRLLLTWFWCCPRTWQTLHSKQQHTLEKNEFQVSWKLNW